MIFRARWRRHSPAADSRGSRFKSGRAPHLALVLLFACVLPAGAQTGLGPFKNCSNGHITSQTTTTLIAAVAGKNIILYSLSASVDGNGAATAVTFQDTAAVNIAGAGLVYILNPGQTFTWPFRGITAGNSVPIAQLATGVGLQVVTGTGNGPVEVFCEFLQQ